MHLRVRYRLSFAPFAIIGACVAAIVAIWLGPLHEVFEHTARVVPLALTGLCLLVPVAFLAWYAFSYVDVCRNTLTVRSTFHAARVDLRELSQVEVYAREPGAVARLLMGGVARRDLDLLLRIEDEQGGRVLLPLNAWRDEELLMARVLRGTVDRRVRIEGDPFVVRRFSGLLYTYKSWERRQQAAA